MKQWLLRFFNLFPFFDADEYDRQVQAEAAARQAAAEIHRRNAREFRINPIEQTILGNQQGRPE